MKEDDGAEGTEREGEGRGIADRAKGAVGSARQQVSRSADLMTGADIRRFDEFGRDDTGCRRYTSRPVGLA